MRTPSGKTENKALNTIECVIDEHPTMDYHFNSMDKEMAWDGFIYIYKSALEQSKNEFDDRIPVQIKGHIDSKREYLNKSRITYKVELSDLNIYFNDRGVIYFQVFISDDGKQREIFYNSMYPSKIKGYLDEARKKKNKASKNITFIKLKKNANEIYRIVKQFSSESGYQGSGRSPIVHDMIPIKNFDKVTSITATALGAHNEYELLRHMATGDVCFYGTVEGNPYKLPIEWRDDTKIFMHKELKIPIHVSDSCVYSSYRIDADSDNNITMHLSDNLSMDSVSRRFIFKPTSNIEEIARDARFLYEVIERQGFYVGERFLECPGICLSKNLEDSLNLFITIHGILKDIDFEFFDRIDSSESQIMNELITLVKMKRGLFNEKLSEKMTIFNWSFKGKIVPVLVCKRDEDDENDLSNAAYANKFACFVGDDNDKPHRVPSFGCIEGTALLNLYKYDYDMIEKQIEQEDVDIFTADNLNSLSLRLIQIYDKYKNVRALRLAKLQQEKIEKVAQRPHYLLNVAQIRLRLEEDISEMSEEILGADDGSSQVGCGINTVLGNKEKAIKFYNMMSEEERIVFEEWPMSEVYHRLVD